eukprot:TRINITY_DN62174_c0_g1_i1.p1 TRINITY_DN62174_c0_g1~~TRINITY_DN62174_c0_g1_i1.p1  ORF type:complete len:614 (+),score=38.72 TRINITY_DN62174_c0_g1_i1:145-1986(+)
MLCGLTAVLYLAGYSAASTPIVTVEEGGTIVLPCNPINVTSCRLANPSGFMMTAFLDGFSHDVEAEPYNSTHCKCILPPADAEAPVDVSFRTGGVSSTNGVAGRVQYVALWTTSLSRRPYLSIDDHAEVAVGLHSSVHGATISIEREGSNSPFIPWVSVQGGVATTVRFPLSGFPPVTEAVVRIVMKREGGPILERRLFLSRVAPPPKTGGSFVQVDYTRKVLLVNGNPLLGVGYYDSQSIGQSNFSRQAAAGINWGMRYLTYSKSSRLSDTFIQHYLDWSHSVGMFVMFDLHTEFEALVVTSNTTELWAKIASQVTKFKDHPALLGWYICDDCTTQWLLRQEQAETPSLDNYYRALKELDPHHPAIGAEECGNAYTFTTGNSRIPRPSLDIVMIENYVSSLDGNAHTGGVTSPGMDGSFAGWPLTWEPIVNCPGPWLIAGRKDLSDADKALSMYSMSWLSAVLANIPLQLHFRLFPFPSLPIYEDILVQVGRYSLVASQVRDFLLAPPSGVVEPRLVSSKVGACSQCAALWRRDVTGFCALVVIVNTLNTTATATFHLQNGERWPSSASASLRRVDGDGNLKFKHSKLKVTLAAWDTHVYTTNTCNGEILLL